MPLPPPTDTPARKNLTPARLLALLLTLGYTVGAALEGGAGALLFAPILAGIPIVFIWYGEEVGSALAWSPEGHGNWLPGVVIRVLGWALLLALLAGFLWNTLGRTRG